MKTNNLSRRAFLSTLGASAAMGAAIRPHPVDKIASGSGPFNGTGGASPWSPCPTLNNPNILHIMVDQMRAPAWLSSSQLSTIDSMLLPNISGRIQDRAYNFLQYFIAATACTPARSALLTGLYTPQTGLYFGDNSNSAPYLNPEFPTWAAAIALLNPAYQGNFWWFGKWHLSTSTAANPLLPYGFRTRTYPSGGVNVSPNGLANEGSSGGTVTLPQGAAPGTTLVGEVWASDAMIAGDFIAWLAAQQTSSGPWCSTVSLVNPHDIAWAPAWLANPFNPPNLSSVLGYFLPPAGTPYQLYPDSGASLYYPPNYESLAQIPHKPPAQIAFQASLNSSFGTVSDWGLFLNQYFWLQNMVDQQVGLILNALASSPFANNTIIIFQSDHGEYGGSHGLHDKGGAAYDESIHVPLSIQFPGQTSSIAMNQMCSTVDFFGLMCDLATGGNGRWRLAYPDLAKRQSLWSFLTRNNSETRLAPAPLGLPYILHTFDEVTSTEYASVPTYDKTHVLGIRTKNDPANGVAGAKLVYYSEWPNCSYAPDPASTPDMEFYDYNPQAANNTSEMNNDYYSNNALTQQSLQQLTQALGNIGATPTGIAANELMAPLVGKASDGTLLSQSRKASLQSYENFTSDAGTCPTL